MIKPQQARALVEVFLPSIRYVKTLIRANSKSLFKEKQKLITYNIRYCC